MNKYDLKFITKFFTVNFVGKLGKIRKNLSFSDFSSPLNFKDRRYRYIRITLATINSILKLKHLYLYIETAFQFECKLSLM